MKWHTKRYCVTSEGKQLVCFTSKAIAYKYAAHLRKHKRRAKVIVKKLGEP